MQLDLVGLARVSPQSWGLRLYSLHNYRGTGDSSIIQLEQSGVGSSVIGLARVSYETLSIQRMMLLRPQTFLDSFAKRGQQR